MSSPDPIPFADAPDELHRLWNKNALRGDVDELNPPATAEEGYSQIMTRQLRGMQDTAQAMQADIETLEEEALVDGNLRRTLAVCAECETENLEHFYTSKRDGRTLSATCFQQRVEQGVARNPASADS